jgi:hypothetical protein
MIWWFILRISFAGFGYVCLTNLPWLRLIDVERHIITMGTVLIKILFGAAAARGALNEQTWDLRVETLRCRSKPATAKSAALPYSPWLYCSSFAGSDEAVAGVVSSVMLVSF